MDPVETVIAWSIPAGTLLLVAVGGFELIRKKRGKRTGTPLAATCSDEVTAMFYGTKRLELEHRDSVSMMRQEDAQGAPPDADLERGVIRLRPDVV